MRLTPPLRGAENDMTGNSAPSHRVPLEGLVSLADFRKAPSCVTALTCKNLAWLTHEVEAEEAEDDVSFIALMNEVERRNDWQAFRDWYILVWDDHAKFRGYERKANG